MSVPQERLVNQAQMIRIGEREYPIQPDMVGSILTDLRDIVIQDPSMVTMVANRANVSIGKPPTNISQRIEPTYGSYIRVDKKEDGATFCLTISPFEESANTNATVIMRLAKIRSIIEAEKPAEQQNELIIDLRSQLEDQNIVLAILQANSQRVKNEISKRKASGQEVITEHIQHLRDFFFNFTQLCMDRLKTAATHQPFVKSMDKELVSREEMDNLIIQGFTMVIAAKFEGVNHDKKSQTKAESIYSSRVYELFRQLIAYHEVSLEVKNILLRHRILIDLGSSTPGTAEAMLYLEEHTGQLLTEEAYTADFHLELTKTIINRWDTFRPTQQGRALAFFQRALIETNLQTPGLDSTLESMFVADNLQKGYENDLPLHHTLLRTYIELLFKQMRTSENSAKDVFSSIQRLADMVRGSPFSSVRARFADFIGMLVADAVNDIKWPEAKKTSQEGLVLLDASRRFIEKVVPTLLEFLDQEAIFKLFTAPIHDTLLRTLLSTLKTQMFDEITREVSNGEKVYSYRFVLSYRVDLNTYLSDPQIPDWIRTEIKNWIRAVVQQKDRLLTDLASASDDAKGFLEYVADHLHHLEAIVGNGN